MKSTRLSKLMVIVMLATLWVCSLLSVGWSRSPRQELNPAIPRDVTSARPTQADYDTLAWQLFVALNWPTRNGKVDLQKIIGQAPNAPRVWELFTDPVKIFTENDVKADVLNLSIPQDDKLLYMVRKRVEKISGSQAVQAGSSWPLVDQKRNFAVYEIRINDIQKSYIVSQGLTTPSALGNYKKPILFPNGSIEIKAAWRIFPENTAKDVLARYHTRRAVIAISKDQSSTGAPFQVTATVGLVGLSIVCKTVTQPKWVWATFEHVDNYEISYKPLPGLTPTFSSGSSTDPNRQPAPKPSDGTYLWSPQQPTASQYSPTEVARCPNETALPAATNSHWEGALAAVPGVENSAWQYYRLTAVQWFDAKDRLQPRNQFGVAISRNSVMETFLLGDQTIASQIPAIGPTNADPDITHPNTTLADVVIATIVASSTPEKTGPYTWSSCMLCHEMAQYQFGPDAKNDNVMTDYSFVFRSYLPAGGSTASKK